MSMETVTCELNGIQVECTLEVEPHTPAYTSGPPENCYPAEGGIGYIEEVNYVTDGLVKVNGDWIKFDEVVVDITDLVTHEQIQLLEAQCYEHFSKDQTEY
jgi:hypothetical protein